MGVRVKLREGVGEVTVLFVRGVLVVQILLVPPDGDDLLGIHPQQSVFQVDVQTFQLFILLKHLFYDLIKAIDGLVNSNREFPVAI